MQELALPRLLVPRRPLPFCGRRAPGCLFALAIAVSVVAAGCSSDDDSATTSETSTPVTTDADEPASDQDPPNTETAESEDTDAPATSSGLDGAVGEAADLTLGWFNGVPFDEATYEAAFDANFRDAVGFEQLTPLLDQLRLDRPFEVREIQRFTTTEAELIIEGASGERALLALAVASPDDSTMTGLFIAPAEQPSFDPPASTTDALARLDALGTTRLGAFEADCSPIDGGPNLAPDELAPIGSGFKLWVLAAVVAAVDDGSITWDDPVEIRDELDSVPSGTTQNDQPGSTVTVRQLAERMIEVSDNTATDHLIDLVGRDAVERAFAAAGHGAPERNRPLLTTREFTIVKFTDDDLRLRYLASDEAERRRILDTEVASMPLPPLSNIISITDPVDVETLEWFAAPADLCRVLTMLADDDEAAAVLARNPGVPDTEGRWRSILYKGGSEPGVFAMAWLVEDADGRRLVLAGSIANDDTVIDEFEAAGLLGHLRDTLE